MIQEGKHYVYQHIRLDKDEVFYIGVGTKYNKEKRYKRAYDKKNRNILWKRITNKSEYKVEILLESDDYEFIKQTINNTKHKFFKKDRNSLFELQNKGNNLPLF